MSYFRTIRSLSCTMFVLAVVTCVMACTPKSKGVEYPLYESSNTTALDIAGVTLTDSVTVVNIDAYYRPHNWIRIAKDTYLRAGDKKYMLTSAEGIEIDKEFYMSESGEHSFTLYFEPMPVNTKSFDFIESDCEECFKLFNIDLTGKKSFGKLKGLPKEATKTEGALPDVQSELKTEKTTVDIIMLNYRPELGRKYTLFVNSIFGHQNSYECYVDSTGRCSVSFLQSGPVECFFIDKRHMAMFNALVSPGEHAEFYIDMRYTAALAMNQRKRVEKTGERHLQRCYSIGEYAVLNNIRNNTAPKKYYSMNLYSGKFADYKLSSADYAAHVVEQYRNLRDSIDASGMSDMEKEYDQIQLKREAIEAMTNGDWIRVSNYQLIKQDYSLEARPENMEPIKDEDAKILCKEFDVNDPELVVRVGYATFNLKWGILVDSAENSLLKDICENVAYYYMASDGQLTDAYVDSLRKTGNPFLLDACTKLNKEVQDELKEMASKAQIEDTPDVPLAKLFDTIIAPHKGKVVLVDFWNTWCGPCCMAIENIAPYKKGELSSKDLVWIYIANETSPMLKYKSMVAETPGIHYRLNPEQWEYLGDKFKIDGIPSYVMVEKSGKYSLRNDFRDIKTMVDVLKTELEK